MFMEALIAEFFGAPPDEVRIGYAGYVRDPLMEILLARHRWYDSRAGRWLTRDPAGYVDGLSLYLFVKGNPLGLVDPTGLSSTWGSDAYRVSGDGRSVDVTTTIRTRGWFKATGNFVSVGYWDPGGYHERVSSKTYQWDQAMPNALTAGEYIRSSQTGKLPDAVTPDVAFEGENRRERRQQMLQVGKDAAQDGVIGGVATATAPVMAVPVARQVGSLDVPPPGTTATRGGQSSPGTTAGPNLNVKPNTQEQTLVRRGQSWESQTRLARQAAAAEEHGLPHGVSVTTPESNAALSRNPADAVSAKRRDLEAGGFPVHHTPTRSDPNHHTVGLPKPVTQETTSVFNRLFGRKRKRSE
jgi:RHS repeat-associated protein